MSQRIIRRAGITALGLLLLGGGVADATEHDGYGGPAGSPRPVQTAQLAVAGSCSLAPTAGTITRTLGARSYLLHVPAGLTGPSVPLLLTMHGAGQEGTGLDSAAAIEAATGWDADADAHGFIVAYPASAATRPTAWDATKGGPDVQFLRDVVADISATWCVNPKRVHATGHSSGAIMAERLACDAPDVFASVSAYAGASPVLFGGPCTPSRPVPVGIFQGTLDPVSSVGVGIANRNEWLALNGCPLLPTTELGVPLEASTYGPCQDGVEVVWRVYLLQGHNWPTGADKADIRTRIRALFERNPLP
ncbi:MAG: alpha/beta hydrolase family esterase [Pseudonocardiales bacterium]